MFQCSKQICSTPKNICFNKYYAFHELEALWKSIRNFVYLRNKLFTILKWDPTEIRNFGDALLRLGFSTEKMRKHLLAFLNETIFKTRIYFILFYQIETTSTDKIFEKNSSFQVKKHTTGKVLFLFSRGLLLVLTKFLCGNKTGHYVIIPWSFDIILNFPNYPKIRTISTCQKFD